MSLRERVYQNIIEQNNRIKEGKFNCVPIPFPRFRNMFPGLEIAQYVLISANQKVGKSKFADYIAMFDPFFFFLEHKEVFRLKIIYFTLEMSKEAKYLEFISHLIFKLSNYKIRVSPKDLRGVNHEKPLSQEVLDIMNSDKFIRICAEFEDVVEFIDNISNPTGINKYCREFAMNHGEFVHKDGKIKQSDGKVIDGKVIDYYKPHDPELMKIIILDNFSNLSTESGMDIRQTITKMSKYFVTLRNQLKFTIVAIQHQSQEQEGIENIKMNMMSPTASGLAECRTTIRDINVAFGLYSPFKFKKPEHEGYNIRKFGNYIRFLEVMDDRDGSGGTVCPLYFDGATSYWRELPLPTDINAINNVYNFMNRTTNRENSLILMNYISKNVKNSWFSKVRFW